MFRFYQMVKYVIGEGVLEVPPVDEKPPAEEVPPAEETPTPGFEALFAIGGLLIVAYFVLRKK